MIGASVYPWQQQQWNQLLACKSKQKLPHALLLLGNQGLGKRDFAMAWAQTLLCTGTVPACQTCHSCHLMKAHSHPDFRLLEPEQSAGMIKIDQIRELIQFTSETALQGNNRVVIIHPANAMNIYSANALLKTLEEPGPNTFFILVDDQMGRLPATLVSRCQKIIFNKPSEESARKWLESNVTTEQMELIPLLLKITDHAPLKAKEALANGLFNVRQAFYNDLLLLSEYKADPLQLASEYQEYDLRALLNLLFMWIQDLLRFQTTNGQADLTHADYYEGFLTLSQRIKINNLLSYYDYIKQLHAYLLSNLNLNRQLMLEDLFIQWSELWDPA